MWSWFGSTVMYLLEGNINLVWGNAPLNQASKHPQVKLTSRVLRLCQNHTAHREAGPRERNLNEKQKAKYSHGQNQTYWKYWREYKYSNMFKEIKRRLKYGQGARAYLKKQPSNCEREPSVITENEKNLNRN